MFASYFFSGKALTVFYSKVGMARIFQAQVMAAGKVNHCFYSLAER